MHRSRPQAEEEHLGLEPGPGTDRATEVGGEDRVKTEDVYEEWRRAWAGLGHAIADALQTLPLVGRFFRWYFGLLKRIRGEA
jgi:hypothetical protein